MLKLKSIKNPQIRFYINMLVGKYEELQLKIRELEKEMRDISDVVIYDDPKFKKSKNSPDKFITEEYEIVYK